MEVDRRVFLATLGSAAAIKAMPDEAKAEALEHYMTEMLDEQATGNELTIRRGAGTLFGAGGPGGNGNGRKVTELEKMPEKPTLVDFFKYRFAPATHVLQSATDAMRKGEKEETILACLMHDVVLSLIKVDHGWWGAQMIEPYVSEKVSWAIRHHQALRFYHDLVGFDMMGHVPGMGFVSAGGYHHHLGLNEWAGHGARPAPAGSAGLRRFTVELPSRRDVKKCVVTRETVEKGLTPTLVTEAVADDPLTAETLEETG